MARGSKKNMRDIINIVNVFHVLIGVLVVILTVILFISPEQHLLFFPIIFIMSAISSYVAGATIIMTSGRDKGKRAKAWISIGIGIVLTILCIISAMTVL